VTTPDAETAQPGPSGEERAPLLAVEELSKRYREVEACSDVSLEIYPGQTLGLVGESGSGKSTLALAIAGLVPHDGGTLTLDGQVLPARIGRRRRTARRAIQVVFQNPDATLNPKHRTRFIFARAIKQLAGQTTVEQLARRVRLELVQLDSKPAQLSGGQKQRVAIGRAFAGSPQLVVCDEPVSSLDASMQAAVLNELADLQLETNVAYLFISHDLAVVRYLADTIGVMYLGQVVEIGPAPEVYTVPHHPYTDALLSAAPTLDAPRRRVRLRGPIPKAHPKGCRFHTRCPYKIGAICEDTAPPWRSTGNGHMIRCHYSPEELVEREAIGPQTQLEQSGVSSPSE
jgi:peptide/nickel transport system ATP-binding protein